MDSLFAQRMKEVTAQNIVVITKEVYTKYAKIQELIEKLPEYLTTDLKLESRLYMDYFNDKYLRPTYRRKHMKGKTLGWTFDLPTR